MIASPAAADTQRCRYTSAAHEENTREGRRSVRSRGQSIRGPTDARITGSSVIATSTETSGTSTPPYPTLRSIGTGSTIIDSSPIATVSPEKTTARPACSIATATASAFGAPGRALLPPPAHHEQRVVDRHAKPDERDQELDDLADPGDLGQPAHDQERGEHGDPADQQRQEREERAEDQRQDHQRAQRRRSSSRP